MEEVVYWLKLNWFLYYIICPVLWQCIDTNNCQHTSEKIQADKRADFKGEVKIMFKK